MSREIRAYKCEKCGEIYEEKEKANNCCKCAMCRYYIGKFDKKKSHWVHCSYGYTCDSYASEGQFGNYSKFERR